MKFHCHCNSREVNDVEWYPRVAHELLPRAIAKELGAEFEQTLYGPYSAGRKTIKFDYLSDVAYVPLDFIHKNRCAKFVYSLITDTWHEIIPMWINDCQPDLLLTLNRSHPQWLIDMVSSYGGKCIKSAPCVNIPKVIEKDVLVFSSQTINSAYPSRMALNNMVVQNKEKWEKCGQVMINSNCNYTYQRSYEDYELCLGRSLYFFTGPVFDQYPTFKYYEAAAAGCCIITIKAPEIENIGFNDSNCIFIDWDGKKLGKIPDIGDKTFDEESKIKGIKAREMILKTHSVDVRAKEIANLIKGDLK